MAKMDAKLAYQILEIERTNSVQCIKTAFRKLALKYHPDKCNSKDREKFLQIKEAYKYLMILKDSPENRSPSQQQLPPKELNLNLTLEEICTGCVNYEKIARKITDENGEELIEEAIVKVRVQPGDNEGTRIRIPKVGDKQHGKIQADLIFIVHELPHEQFKRVNRFDIEYVVLISAEESICGGQFEIPTLENYAQLVILNVEDFITNYTTKKIPNLGLPYPNSDGKKRGDLIVSFNIAKVQDPAIEYDLYLTLEQILNGYQKMLTITRLLGDSNKEEDKDITIEIVPGTVAGTKFVFTQEGDRNPRSIPSDIIFIVRDKPNPIFQRINEVDLEYIACLTPEEAILGNGCIVSIPTLDTGVIRLLLNGIILENDLKIIPNRGLPRMGESNNTRGVIIVKFDIKEQNPFIEMEIILSLEDALHGVRKSMEIFRKTINPRNGEETIEEKTLMVNIAPGTVSGTRFIFPREGDRNPEEIPADIEFIVKDEPHDKFVRHSADLIYVVSLLDRLRMTILSRMRNEVKVETLEGDEILLDIDPLEPQRPIKIPNYGLPYMNGNNANSRGDLWVQFEQEISEEVENEAETFIEKCPPLEFSFYLSLEQILRGHIEKFQFERKIVDCEGNETIESDELQLEIKPGIPEGHKLTFYEKGNRSPEKIPGNVILTIHELDNSFFKRVGTDLEYKVKLQKQPFIHSGVEEFCIPTLEEDIITISVETTLLEPGYSIQINGKGLPHYDDVDKRGSLVVRFEYEDNSGSSFINIDQSCEK